MSQVKLLSYIDSIPDDTDKSQENYGQSVITSQVQETAHAFMLFITVMIIVFLVVHLFIRFHYKAKTDYALNELREKFERNAKGPSPYALPKEKDGTTPPKPVEILLEPEQLAPILHHVALAPHPQLIQEPNETVFYKSIS